MDRGVGVSFGVWGRGGVMRLWLSRGECAGSKKVYVGGALGVMDR